MHTTDSGCRYARTFSDCSQNDLRKYFGNIFKFVFAKDCLCKTFSERFGIFQPYIPGMFSACSMRIFLKCTKKCVFTKDCLCKTLSERFGIFQPLIPGMFSACYMRIFLKCNKNLYSQKIACAKRFQNVMEYFSRIFQACSQHVPCEYS